MRYYEIKEAFTLVNQLPSIRKVLPTSKSITLLKGTLYTRRELVSQLSKVFRKNGEQALTAILTYKYPDYISTVNIPSSLTFRDENGLRLSKGFTVKLYFNNRGELII